MRTLAFSAVLLKPIPLGWFVAATATDPGGNTSEFSADVPVPQLNVGLTVSLSPSAESVLVGVHVGGVWRSEDDGETWQASLEPETDVHQVAAMGRVAVVGAARGFGWSRDAGRSWSWTTKGLHASYLQAVALTGDAVFVGASSGPFSHDAAVYRAESRGTPFRRCADGVPEWFETNVSPHRLGAVDDRVAVAVEEAVYVSQDGGRTWKVAATGLPAVRAVAVT